MPLERLGTIFMQTITTHLLEYKKSLGVEVIVQLAVGVGVGHGTGNLRE